VASRPLLIGQAPAKYSEGHPALCGHTGMHLSALSGLSFREFMLRVETRNVLDRFPGSAEHGDLFPMREAREAAALLFPLLDGRRVVFVGANVAAAFGIKRYGFLDWQVLGFGNAAECTGAVIPHPSLVNRWWNEERNRVAAAYFMRDLLDVRTPVAVNVGMFA
jgi:hypothetical protein